MAMKTVALALALNYGVHVGASLAYAKMCMPETVWDIARSMVATASPVCSFLVSTIQATQTNFGTLVSSTLLGMAVTALRPV
jgi:hypothetical protein